MVLAHEDPTVERTQSRTSPRDAGARGTRAPSGAPPGPGPAPADGPRHDAGRESRLADQLAEAVRQRAARGSALGPGAEAARTSRNPYGATPYPPRRMTRCETASGPAYAPAGPNVPWAANVGGMKQAPFTFAATFNTAAQSAGAKASCCEVRQYIRWDNAFQVAAGEPPHAGFAGLGSGVWHEDRDENDHRYGHRTGVHSDPGPGDQYYDSAGRTNQSRGSVYRGSDMPTALATDTGTWEFRLDTIDRCNGDAVVASSPVIRIAW